MCCVYIYTYMLCIYTHMCFVYIYIYIYTCSYKIVDSERNVPCIYTNMHMVPFMLFVNALCICMHVCMHAFRMSCILNPCICVRVYYAHIYRCIYAHIHKQRPWYVQPTSALCGEGLHEAMDWILAKLSSRAHSNVGTEHYP